MLTLLILGALILLALSTLIHLHFLIKADERDAQREMDLMLQLMEDDDAK
jgi:hypothetical protein